MTEQQASSSQAGPLRELKFDAHGLITAVVQDATTHEVLMVAWMNRESLELTLEGGYTVFWSLSRNKLWKKGRGREGGIVTRGPGSLAPAGGVAVRLGAQTDDHHPGHRRRGGGLCEGCAERGVAALHVCVVGWVGTAVRRYAPPDRAGGARWTSLQGPAGACGRRAAGGSVPTGHSEPPGDAVEQQLTLLGLLAMEDPPRPEVPAALDACHLAGVRVIMVTGDNGLTAAAISAEIGMHRGTPRVITGPTLDRLNENQLDAVLEV